MIFRESDKVYWHQYIDFYNLHLPNQAFNILEIGVFEGDSIRYWESLYPKANIFGIDIIEEQKKWPKSNNISYFQLDQSDVKAYNDLLNSIEVKFDIIIEDGSHDPLHQKVSLIESIDFMAHDSIFILEDIHTSHHNHPYYIERQKNNNKLKPFYKKKKEKYLMPLQALLAIQHLKKNKIDIDTLNSKIDFENSLFSFQELKKIYSNTKNIHFYKRTTLPSYCYSCKGNDFDYITQKCKCGIELMSETDSMTAILKF